jgi:hypothetical protein
MSHSDKPKIIPFPQKPHLRVNHATGQITGHGVVPSSYGFWDTLLRLKEAEK